jgi:glutathione S-transferase
MIVVHHLDLSRSHRVLWLLEELGLPYEVRPYRRDAQTLLAPPELREVHPLGKSPVITDGGFTLAESGAILEYLAEREGRLAPATGTPERARYLYWLHYAEGSLMPPLFLKRLYGRIEPTLLPALLAQLQRHLAMIEGALAEAPWFAGEAFSAADIQMSYPLEVARQRIGLDGAPHAAQFLEACRGRPAFQRALQRGGAFGVPTFPG